MKYVVGCDPGPEMTAVVLAEINPFKIFYKDHCLSDRAMDILKIPELRLSETVVGIEKIESFGMAVGESTFETCYWIGEYRHQLKELGVQHYLIGRKEIKLHLCGSTKAKDANIRQRLIDIHGPVGTKKNPGPLFGISSHLWSALAVATYTKDNYAK